jgi:RNA ligase
MIEILNKYYDDGLLMKQTHPTLPLTIWNYTPKVQYESLWDDITIMCRGLVTDDGGNIVARPFRKFFNLEENKHTPTKEFDVYTKLDGSLGILFNYNNEWVLATRGSFTSDQAIKGREILTKYNLNYLNKDNTYLFEIIYPNNIIVVRYDMEELVLLGTINTQTGEEYDIHNQDYSHSGFTIVEKHNGITDYNTLKKLIKDNEEGYVVKFSNGDRLKIKGEEYLRLHKIMTNVSTTSIWELLSNGGSLDVILSDVPDEFYTKIKDYETQLIDHFNIIKREYEWIFKIITRVESGENRAIFAQYAKRYKYPSLLFSLLDGKDITKSIWKILKPKFEKL